GLFSRGFFLCGGLLLCRFALLGLAALLGFTFALSLAGLGFCLGLGLLGRDVGLRRRRGGRGRRRRRGWPRSRRRWWRGCGWRWWRLHRARRGLLRQARPDFGFEGGCFGVAAPVHAPGEREDEQGVHSHGLAERAAP